MKIKNLAKINQVATAAAAQAFSRLIGVELIIEATHLKVQNVDQLVAPIAHEPTVVSVESTLSGSLSGSTLLLMSHATFVGIVDLAVKREIDPPLRREDAEGIIKELGNIIVGNYLQEFAKSLPGSTLLHGLSRVATGSPSVIAQALQSTVLPAKEKGLLIEINFGVRHSTLKGYLIFILAGVEWEEA